MLRLAWLVLVAAVTALFLKSFVAEIIYIPSPSMEPTLPVGTYAVLDKITFKLREPERGDIIVFRSPEDREKELVKRVIATPLETVELRQKTVWVNGKKLNEPYVQYTRPQDLLRGDNLEPTVVSPRSVFVLGDNRDESRDSTVWADPQTHRRILFVPYISIRGVVRGFY